jgi:hypothetical protein
MASRYDLLFEQWKSSLVERDRRTPSVQGNFEELFDTLKSEGLILESAYEFLPKAIKAHSPAPTLVKTMFKKLKTSPKFQYANEREFEEQWVKDIADRANVAFFNVFPVQTKKSNEEEEPAMFGSMTAKEYKLQRSHADSFPRLNIEDIKRQRQESNYDPLSDMGTLLGKVNDDSK